MQTLSTVNYMKIKNDHQQTCLFVEKDKNEFAYRFQLRSRMLNYINELHN